jgi:hypothetical protein
LNDYFTLRVAHLEARAEQSVYDKKSRRVKRIQPILILAGDLARPFDGNYAEQ